LLSVSVAAAAADPTARDAAVVAVLDDDPTGAQEVVDTPVLFDWSQAALARLPGHPFHVITNTRAHSSEEAYAITRDVAFAVMRRFPRAQIVLRGDSTLRAHLREEYEAVRTAAFPHVAPTLLLVPALPTAGRVTVDGIHLLERDGTRTPLHETEYAHDGDFAYSSARLLDWADERSGGLFPAAGGVEIPLAQVRRRGGAAVYEAVAACGERGGPSVCVPDAETITDLEAIAEGLRVARAHSLPVIVRCAPTFAAVFCRTLAPKLLPVPRADSILVLCGSYVPQTTRQLASLLERRRDALVELDLPRLVGEHRGREVRRAARAARALLARDQIAVVATPRSRAPVADDPTAAELITHSLASLTRLLADRAELVLFKGGITSAVGVRDGLGARLATVEGPVRPGVALWRLQSGRRCLIFPGNVGGDDALADLVDEVLLGC